MASLTADRNTKRREGVLLGLEAAEEIFAGAMVSVDSSGKAVAATADGNDCVGVAQHHAASGEQVRVRRGVFNFADSAGSISRTDIGATAYVVDDHTVKKTLAENETAATAGIVWDVDADGVWVKI